MKLSKILIITIWIYLILLWTTFIFVSNNWMVNLTSIFLITALVLVLEYFLFTLNSRNAPLILFFVVFTSIFFLLRFWYFCFFPSSMKYIGYGVPIGIEYTNKALLHLLLSTLFAGIGLKIGSRSISLKAQSKVDTTRIPFISQNILITMMIVFMFICLYAYFVTGVGRFGDIRVEDIKSIPPLLAIFNIDNMLVIFITAKCEHLRLSKKGKWWLFVIPALYFLIRTIRGSRAGIFYLSLFFFIYILARNGDFKINIKKYLAPSIAVILIAISGLYFGTLTRGVWQIKEFKGKAISPLTIFEHLETPSNLFSLNKKDKGMVILTQISGSLGGLDPLMVVINHEREGVKRYVNANTVFKNLVNRFIPGTVFPDVLTADTAFSAIYLGITEEHIRQSYWSHFWTIYGTYYVHFGWLGSIIAVFVTSCLLAMIFGKINQSRTPYKIFLRVGCILSFYWIIINSLDSAIFLVVEVFAQGAFYLIILQIFSSIFRDMKPVVKRFEVHHKI